MAPRLLSDVEFDPEWKPGSRRGAKVIYLDVRPEDDPVLVPWSTVGVPQDMLCPVCMKGRLTLAQDEMGYCDMYICTKGCSQPYGYEMD